MQAMDSDPIPEESETVEVIEAQHIVDDSDNPSDIDSD